MTISKEQLKIFMPIFARWLLGLVAVLGLLATFTELVEDVWFREGFSWDQPVILAIHRLSTPTLDAIMWGATQFGQAGAIAATILAAAWSFRKHKLVDAYAILISSGGAAALNTLLKVLLTRPRPALFPPLVVESSYSFPSGHVTAAVAVFGFLAVLLWRNGRYGWAIAAGAVVPLVALSRIYLGVHYPSDTLGSLTFASLWLIVVFCIRDRYLRKMK
jgi:membrane-associated phospholipid phosphatase